MMSETTPPERVFQPEDVLAAYHQVLARIEGGKPIVQADLETGGEPASAEEESFAEAIKGTAVEQDLAQYFDRFLKEDTVAGRLFGHPQPLSPQDRGLVLLNILVNPMLDFFDIRDWSQLALLSRSSGTPLMDEATQRVAALMQESAALLEKTKPKPGLLEKVKEALSSGATMKGLRGEIEQQIRWGETVQQILESPVSDKKQEADTELRQWIVDKLSFGGDFSQVKAGVVRSQLDQIQEFATSTHQEAVASAIASAQAILTEIFQAHPEAKPEPLERTVDTREMRRLQQDPEIYNQLLQEVAAYWEYAGASGQILEINYEAVNRFQRQTQITFGDRTRSPGRAIGYAQISLTDQTTLPDIFQTITLRQMQELLRASNEFVGDQRQLQAALSWLEEIAESHPEWLDLDTGMRIKQEHLENSPTA